ncbi:MAG: hypothetical protein JSR99_03435 [Proteobacteria bacterium]|nr:hypothetical protein [Pseudomonadota bacterium]
MKEPMAIGGLSRKAGLTALRREGLDISVWQFLKLGLIVMPPALVVALACV